MCATLLLLGAEVEQHRGAGRDGRRLDPGRVLVAGQLLVERLLVRGREALAAVLRGKQMPARPASNSIRWTSRSRATAASSSSSVRSFRSGSRSRSTSPMAGGWRGSKARARRRKLLDVLAVLRAHAARSRRFDDVGEALAVLGRRAEQGPVDGEAAQEEVQVVLEGHPDAAVDLDAVLQQLGAVVADVRLGRARQLAGVGGSAGGSAAVAASLIGMAGLEPGLHVGEPVLELLVGRQRPAERVPVERPLHGHVEGGLHGADRLGVDDGDRPLRAGARPGHRPPRLRRPRRGRDPDVVEADDREPAGQVDGVHGGRPTPRRCRRVRAPGSARRRCDR